MARTTDDLSSPSEQERRLAGAASDEEVLRAAGSLLSEEEKQRLAEPDEVISGRPGFTDHDVEGVAAQAPSGTVAVEGPGISRLQRLPENGVIERIEESVTLGKRLRDLGGVRVSTRTEVETQTLRDTLQDTSVEVEHIPVGRFVDAAEEPRVEGDVTVVPVYEERLVVEKRLFLVEEVHLRRVARTRDVEVPVDYRRQVADVERLPPLDISETADTHQGVTRMMDSTSSGTRTVTAMFDNAAEAERAIARLRSAGVPDSAIRHTGGSSSGYISATNTTDTTYQDQHKGFWDSLGDFFFPEEDRYTYAEGLSRGSHMVAVTEFDASMHDTIVDILDDEGSVDLDEREAEWRSSGWSGYQGSDYYREGDISGTGGMAGGTSGQYATGAAGMSAAATGVDMNTRGTIYDDGMQDRTTQMAADTGRRSQADLGSQQQGFASSGSMGQTGGMGTTDRKGMGSDFSGDRVRDDGTVEVVEEELAVGKRAVDRGAVRVRSYVREEPVSADVDLRSERVYVERRPVNRTATPGDLQDQSIEARETSEEAVVAKEARVVEEIGLRQETEVEHQQIQDTVRKTEVEIEDTRTGDSSRLTGNRKDRDNR